MRDEVQVLLISDRSTCPLVQSVTPLSGSTAELRQCIRFNLDCADVCAATGSIATRRTGSNEDTIRAMLEVCITACELCGDECQRHSSKHGRAAADMVRTEYCADRIVPLYERAYERAQGA